MGKTITPNDIAELRLIFNENEPIPEFIVLGGYSLQLAETERVEDYIENPKKPKAMPVPTPTIHAFYINPTGPVYRHGEPLEPLRPTSPPSSQ